MIKRPVSVEEMRVSSRSPKRYNLVDGHNSILIIDYAKDTLDEIAAALNGPAEGTFEWAVKWMMENEGKPLTYWGGGRWVMFSGNIFYDAPSHPENAHQWEPLIITKRHIQATDWRKAE
jgi:hypothetical protein